MKARIIFPEMDTVVELDLQMIIMHKY